MAQDDSKEKEAGSTNPSRPEGRAEASQEKTAEEQSDFEVGKQGTENPAEQDLASPDRKPTIPDSQKPQIPQEENIPAGGPGGQSQTQPTQTQEEKVKKIKERLKNPIHTAPPQERKKSSDLEDEHNKDVLSQP